MKAISLHQPWAQLVVFGEKWIETRSWQTHYRGRLLIHASKGRPPGFQNYWSGPFRDALQRHGVKSIDELSRGAIIGSVALVAVIKVESVPIDPDRWEIESQEPFGDFSAGRWLWLLEDFREYTTPIFTPGSQGLWNYDLPHFDGIAGAKMTDVWSDDK